MTPRATTGNRMENVARSWMAHAWGVPERSSLDPYELQPPTRAEVTIRVPAAGVSPAKAKYVPAPWLDLTLPVAADFLGMPLHREGCVP